MSIKEQHEAMKESLSEAKDIINQIFEKYNMPEYYIQHMTFNELVASLYRILLLSGGRPGMDDDRNYVNTEDATATSNKILKDYTAYVKGEKITGTILIQTENIVLDKTNDNVSINGYYDDSSVSVKYTNEIIAEPALLSQTIKTNDNGFLKQVKIKGLVETEPNFLASNIKFGVNMFGLNGTYDYKTNSLCTLFCGIKDNITNNIVLKHCKVTIHKSGFTGALTDYDFCTDDTGNFRVTIPNDETYDIKIYAEGYEDGTFTVSIPANTLQEEQSFTLNKIVDIDDDISEIVKNKVDVSIGENESVKILLKYTASDYVNSFNYSDLFLNVSVTNGNSTTTVTTDMWQENDSVRRIENVCEAQNPVQEDYNYPPEGYCYDLITIFKNTSNYQPMSCFFKCRDGVSFGANRTILVKIYTESKTYKLVYNTNNISNNKCDIFSYNNNTITFTNIFNPTITEE